MYEARTEQYVQNRLEKEDSSNDIRPEIQESVRFWNRIQDQPVTHNDEVKWLKKVEGKLRGTAMQEKITITTDKLKNQLSRVRNWKTPGPDKLQGYWITTFTSCH